MRRTFEVSHPWITFALDLRDAPPELWMLLGEARSKVEHVAGIPLKPAVSDRLLQLYLARGVLATTAIEGNTLTEEDVQRQLRGELRLPPSRQYLQQEVQNVVDACNAIGGEVLAGVEAPLTRERMCAFNRMVLRKLPLGEGVEPGVLRQHSVVVGRYQGAPAADLPHLTDRLCTWLGSEAVRGPGDLVRAILTAVVAHLYIAWIHPFGDGNGRTARLVEFQILLAAGVPSVAAHLLSNHYNQTRAEYYRQLDLASKRRDPLGFVQYAVQGLVDGLREQIDAIRVQQLLVHWVDLIHEVLPERGTPATARRRQLAVDLSLREAAVPFAEIPLLSPALAAAYAGKTAKTVQRDLGLLERRGLVERTRAGARARREIILAFLPARPPGAGSP